MSLLHNRPTVTTTAAPLWTRQPYAQRGKVRVAVQNPSATAIYLGKSGVTTSAYGYSLASATLVLELDGDDILYAVSGSSVQVNVLVSGA